MMIIDGDDDAEERIRKAKLELGIEELSFWTDKWFFEMLRRPGQVKESDEEAIALERWKRSHSGL
jgi:hypothetical protein